LPFLAEIGITRWLMLSRDGLTAADEPDFVADRAER
jgi:hypothetical protein